VYHTHRGRDSPEIRRARDIEVGGTVVVERIRWEILVSSNTVLLVYDELLDLWDVRNGVMKVVLLRYGVRIRQCFDSAISYLVVTYYWLIESTTYPAT
jgi:hypothetical protein